MPNPDRHIREILERNGINQFESERRGNTITVTFSHHGRRFAIAAYIGYHGKQAEKSRVTFARDIHRAVKGCYDAYAR